LFHYLVVEYRKKGGLSLFFFFGENKHKKNIYIRERKAIKEKECTMGNKSRKIKQSYYAI
jgi:hypothetical protein